jgi:hypothetical protein
MHQIDFRLPQFTTVDAHGQTEITLKLPRFLTRLVPGAAPTRLGSASAQGREFTAVASYQFSVAAVAK